MSYYRLLGLDKEPFSTSPDPDFFYESKEHRAALLRLIIQIRLKRGLSLILGDVGTGKTTLSRKLFQMLKAREDIIFHMVLDPTYESEQIFLDSLVRTFGIDIGKNNPTILDHKEAIKGYLFRKGVEEKRTVVLLVDEAQKLNRVSLEVLRVLLNYETNEYKLLQLVLLSQLEIMPLLKEMVNFTDRIGLNYVLQPLAEDEIQGMLDFRLAQAGYRQRGKLFTADAVREIYQYTGGYPRKITMVCHEALKGLVMENKAQVDTGVIRSIIARDRLDASALRNTV